MQSKDEFPLIMHGLDLVAEEHINTIGTDVQCDVEGVKINLLLDSGTVCYIIDEAT